MVVVTVAEHAQRTSEGDESLGHAGGSLADGTLAKSPTSDDEDWVTAIIEGGELEAIREALADSQNEERKTLTKWIKAEEKYGTKLRELRIGYETSRSNTQRLFSAVTRGLV